ncbi:MAG: hypothetical protein SGILL_007874, partial [Bacillariaceae sp.]
HRAERLESSEFQQESLQEAIETLKAEHAQALLFQKQEYDTLLQDESAHRVALKQTLHGQETLLQAERKRSKSMKDSIDRLEQVSQKEWVSTRNLQEENVALQREYETEKQELEQRYKEAWQKSKAQRKVDDAEHAQSLKQVKQQMMERHLQCQKTNRLVSQLLLVVDVDENDDEDGGYFAFDITDDMETLQKKGKMLQETVEESRKYVGALKSRTGRDHTFTVPSLEVSKRGGLEIHSGDCDGIEISLPGNNNRSLPIVTTEYNDDDEEGGEIATTLLKHSCMLLFAAAGFTLAPKAFTSWTTSFFAPTKAAKY